MKFLIFLGVNGRCWARAYVWRINESTLHPPPRAYVASPRIKKKENMSRRGKVFNPVPANHGFCIYFVWWFNPHKSFLLFSSAEMFLKPLSQYVNWNKHPVPVPPSSRLIHYELQHSCVTSCRKSWCESCWYSCNCEGPPIKIHFSIDLSNCYCYNDVIMYTCVTGQVVQIWTTQDDTNDDGIFRLSTWLFWNNIYIIY